MENIAILKLLCYNNCKIMEIVAVWRSGVLMADQRAPDIFTNRKEKRLRIWLPLRRQLRSERGSTTLESAIIFPLVFFTTGMMFYLTVVTYERAAAHTAANGAVLSASVYWSNGGVESQNLSGVSGRTPGAAPYPDELYWRIIDRKLAQKEKTMAEEAVTRFGRTGLSGFTKIQVFPKFQSGILAKSIHIVIDNDTYLWEERVPKHFERNSHYVTSLGTQSIIPDLAEFQRNIDFIVELEQRLEEKYPELKGAMDQYSSLIDRIHGYIGGLV